ncbi:hypothetical protein AMS68_007379 [Peltaster fructicola]|uniref:Peptidase M43 pregnancy-associated plasma-A domain-containing protein n=1 Tax=Peltaster fructicola TaxID=286661 RepID=A0A6H0Y4B3_9PEZI|nr:hypothetical protein AMS68_007379 [Peltaster fructicola]
MRSFLAVALAFVGLAAAATNLAQPAQSVNTTHFTDPGTGKTFRHFDCGVTQGNATAELKSTLSQLHTRDLSGPSIGARDARYVGQRATAVTINTYFHVITKQASVGSITQSMVNQQLSALNTMYKPFGITFNLVATDFTANDAWAVAAGSDMDACKKALRKGKYADLNLYFHTDLDGGILGTCTLPTTVPKGAAATVYYSDGCNVQAETMPGGNIYGYSAGMTAVHETGHWLGLLHTFEGYSCTGTGDYIADTRVEATSTDGCPDSPAKNSCTNVAGVDPIHNVMDYSTDACYTGFTPGQISRVQTLWTQYRQGN